MTSAVTAAVYGNGYGSDEKLLRLLVEDLQKEGGVCQVDSLIALNPSIRRLLGDRRLVIFLKGRRIDY